MVALYTVSFLDRVNVGFAALTMNKESGFHARDLWLGRGGYSSSGIFLFEIPSNVILTQGSARAAGSAASWRAGA